MRLLLGVEPKKVEQAVPGLVDGLDGVGPQFGNRCRYRCVERLRGLLSQKAIRTALQQRERQQ